MKAQGHQVFDCIGGDGVGPQHRKKADDPTAITVSINRDNERDSHISTPNKAPLDRHPTLAYRADIDGLRTVAVVAVVIFHAWPKLFPGGFIGVDVFFVISGYLVSGIIYREHQKGAFSYANFYSRRIRRIYPALLLVLLCSVVLGCFALWEDELQAMMRTLIGGTLFSANLQILSLKGGYFDPEVTANPLLHLWSLGVEEQYYIVWPFLAAIVARSTPKKAFALLFSYTAASFFFNVAAVGPNPKLSFYSPLSRFWQMTVGSILAYHHLRRTQQIPSRRTQKSPDSQRLYSASTSISLLGFAMVILSFILLDEESTFPGYWALLPTVGALLIIAAGQDAAPNHYFLAHPFMVFVGAISYPLYLWHWPLLVFSRMLYRDENSTELVAQPSTMVALSVGLSIATYYLLEQKVRHRKSKFLVIRLSAYMVAMSLLATVVLMDAGSFSYLSATTSRLDVHVNIGTTGNNVKEGSTVEGGGASLTREPVIINSSRGPRRDNATVEKVRAAIHDWKFPPDGFGDLLGNSSYHYLFGGWVLNPEQSETVVVFGDSHARQLSHRFVKLYDDARATNRSFPSVIYKAWDGTPPLQCTKTYGPTMEMVKKLGPKALLISFNWPQFIRPGGQESDPLHDPLPCCKRGYVDSCSYQSPKDADRLLEMLFNDVKEITAQGKTKVYMVTVGPEGREFNPFYMSNPQGLVPENMQPISLSAFRKKHEWLIRKVEKGIEASGAVKIDLADNACWEDVCEVLELYGHPIMKDSDHYRPFFVREYLRSLDVVVS